MRFPSIHFLFLILFSALLTSCNVENNPADPGNGGDGPGGGNGGGTTPCATFSITSVEPAVANSGEIYSDFTVNGINFHDGSELDIRIVDGDDTVATGTSPSYVDSTQVSCEMDLDGVDYGEYHILMTNGCDTSPTTIFDYTIEPDISKNIGLRPGDDVEISDIGIAGETHEIFVLFDDGELWIYQEGYTAGTHQDDFNDHDLVSVPDPAEATLGGRSNDDLTAWVRATGNADNYVYADYVLDVMSEAGYSRHYFMYVDSSYITFIRMSLDSSSHSGNSDVYNAIGSGPLNLDISAIIAADMSHEFTGSDAGWIYVLEGDPEFAVERILYESDSDPLGTHSHDPDMSFFGTQGDNFNELNDPRDIACDSANNVYILDVLSDDTPVVKVYNEDMDYLGRFGDDWNISGDPLRLDIDRGSGDVHVAHSDGISIFTPDQIDFI